MKKIKWLDVFLAIFLTIGLISADCALKGKKDISIWLSELSLGALVIAFVVERILRKRGDKHGS